MYFPLASIVPPALPSCTDQTTPVLEVPDTVAENVWEAPAVTVAVVAEGVIVIDGEVEGGVAVEEPPQAVSRSTRNTVKMATTMRMARTTTEGRLLPHKLDHRCLWLS